jgi:hypothetical protein
MQGVEIMDSAERDDYGTGGRRRPIRAGEVSFSPRRRPAQRCLGRFFLFPEAIEDP